MVLTERLQRIADYIEKGERVIDVGTDHGYIPIYLVREGLCSKVIAGDVNRGPIDIVNENIRKTLGESSIEVRLGDGLKTMEIGEADTAILAGMGGLLMVDILSADLQKTKSLKKLILQPRNAQDKLRKWLNENDFFVQQESLVREGKYLWEVLVVMQGHEHIPKEIFYEVGFKLIENKDPYLMEYLDNKIRIEEEIVKNASLSSRENAKENKERSLEKISRLKELKSYVNK